MSIKSNIQEMKAKLAAEEGKPNTPVADDMRAKVVQAIVGGSAQWDDYMRLFAKNDEELARLRPDPLEPEVSERNLARAYLVGNGVCTVLTHRNLDFGVEDALDY